MVTKTTATIDDLYHMPDDGKYELVNGEVRYMSPTGGEHNAIGSEILFVLKLYERERDAGRALMDNAGYVINQHPGTVLSPDVSYTYETQKITPKFLEGAPRFAVEIRSPSDYDPQKNAEYEDKRHLYFDAGTQVVWDVDPRTRTITSYRADQPDAPTIFTINDTADAEPALPGWRVAVADLFR